LEQRVAERTRELADSEGRYRLLAENSLDVIVRGRLDGTVLYASPASLRLLGCHPDELLGRSIETILHADDIAVARHVLERLRNDQEEILCAYRARHGRGYDIWCEGAFRALREPDGTAVDGFLVTIRDITQRKEAEDAAREAMTVATRANQAKSLFVASMSHELRTPLNAINGFAEMLAQGLAGELTDKQRTYVGYVLRSGNILLGLVDDVLTFASIDSAPLSVALEPISVEDVLEDIEPTALRMAADKSISFSIEKFALPLPQIVANPRRLVQVLINLCSNAIKYNRPGGSVVVSAAIDSPGMVALSVSDTGIGIPADAYDSIFEPFNRLGAEAGAIEGTGVGLTICRRLVAAMNGRIVVSSEVGAGSRFTVLLPAAPGGLARTDTRNAMAEFVDDGIMAPRSPYCHPRQQ
jgi:PAS domain S-box-containing protein